LKRLWTIGIWITAIAVVGAIVYGEFVQDWRIRRSAQSLRYAMRVMPAASIADYNRLQAAMTQKYGAGTQTILHIDTGMTEIKLDDKLLETHPELKKIGGVSGIFVFGPDNDIGTRFPFEVSADLVVATSTRWVHDNLTRDFKRIPLAWLEFGESDWTLDRCVSRPGDLGLGVIGNVLRLHGGTYCVVSWKGKQPGVMLVSVSVADGDPWMRPFTRRICRAITDAALRDFDPENADSPKYAACILADRPSYVSGRKSLAIDAYSVGPDNRLARIQ
jgi:hypothetical protein